MSEHRRVIRFADVAQTFGRDDGSAVTALEGVTFDIGRNEFLAVLGPSGCDIATTKAVYGEERQMVAVSSDAVRRSEPARDF